MGEVGRGPERGLVVVGEVGERRAARDHQPFKAGLRQGLRRRRLPLGEVLLEKVDELHVLGGS